MTPDTPPKRLADLIAKAESDFAEYFRRNYPGPDTVIGKPDWHSPKLFRAATRDIIATLTSEAEAMVAAALRDAISLCSHEHEPYVLKTALMDALQPASAALDKLIAEAVKVETEQLRGTLEYLRAQARNGTLVAQVVIQNVDFALSPTTIRKEPKP